MPGNAPLQPITTNDATASNVHGLQTAGAQYKITTMSRKSHAYLINDNELASLEDIGTHIAASGSFVAFCLTMVLAALWDLGYSYEASKIPFAVGWMAVWECRFWVSGNTLNGKNRGEKA